MPTRFSLAFAIATALSANVAYAYQADKVYRLTVLHTNDFHGHFMANARGEAGYAAQKTLIDQIRKEVEGEGGSVLLLNAGDVNTGTPESDTQQAMPDIKAMNMLGYEAMVLGNHEFDNPMEVLKQQSDTADFVFLAANVESEEGLPAKPFTIFDKDGLKIGVLGLTTPDTAKLGNPKFISKVKFTEPQAVTAQILKTWQEEQAVDVSIALTHLGYYPKAEHGSNAPGDVSLARAMEKGALDMIIGGHTHDTVCVHADGSFNDEYQAGDACMPDKENGVWIMQAGEWGKYLGRADFTFVNGELSLERYQLLPINLKKKVKKEDGSSEYVLYEQAIEPDAAVQALTDEYISKGDALLSEKIAVLEGDLDGDRTHIRFFQTNLGRLIAEAQRQRAQADIAIINSGGVRDSISAGEITYRDVLTVQPFGNTITSVSLSGEELLAYLTAAAMKLVDSGGYPQFSTGLEMVVDYESKKVSDVRIAGAPLDLNKRYTLAVPSYLAGGGDGYPVLTLHPTFVDTGFVDAEALKVYFQAHSPVRASDFQPRGEVVFPK